MDYRHRVASLPRHGGARGYSSDGLSRPFAHRAPCIANGTPTTHPCACAGVAQGKPSAISPVSFIRSLNASRCRPHPHAGKRHFRCPPSHARLCPRSSSGNLIHESMYEVAQREAQASFLYPRRSPRQASALPIACCRIQK